MTDLNTTIDQLQRRLKELDAERTDIVAALGALERVANPMRVSGADKDDDAEDALFGPQNWVKALDGSKMSLGAVFALYGWTDKMGHIASRHLFRPDCRPGVLNYEWMYRNVSRPGRRTRNIESFNV